MISVNQAREILSENTERAEKKMVSLEDSLDLVVAENIISPIDVPSFDNSAMDGYVMEFDGQRKEWEMDGLIQAGDTSAKKIEKGKAARIFTGAKMPEGANTVIQQELVVSDEKSGKIFYSSEKIQKGSNVRLKGSQCKEGELILKKGTKVTPGIIGLLASVGIAEIKIYFPPAVAFIITGDELKEVGTALQEGEIYNSNGPMLRALLKKVGIREIRAYKAADDKQELQQIINEALDKNEVILLSGGISVGDYDFVKECLEKSGIKELFYKIKQRPGKPFYAGKKERQHIFALPGNPASVLSCFNQYVKPTLAFIMGHEEVWKPDHILALGGEQTKKLGFTFFVKARKEGKKVQVLSGQQSFNLQAFNTANCLVELEEGAETVAAGTQVKVYEL